MEICGKGGVAGSALPGLGSVLQVGTSRAPSAFGLPGRPPSRHFTQSVNIRFYGELCSLVWVLLFESPQARAGRDRACSVAALSQLLARGRRPGPERRWSLRISGPHGPEVQKPDKESRIVLLLTLLGCDSGPRGSAARL